MELRGQEGANERPRAMRRPVRLARARRPVSALAMAAMALAGPARAATVTRTEDQRLAVPAAAADEQAYSGTTVGTNADGSGTIALVGAPQGGQGSGALHRFAWTGSHWQWTSSIVSAAGPAQRRPMAHGLDFVVTADRSPNGSTTIAWFGTTDQDFLQVSYADPIEAIAYHEPLLALGMPDGIGGRGLVVIYRRASEGWEYAGDLAGAEPGDHLGSALAVNGTLVVAGAPGHGDNGAAYLFVCCDADEEWVEWQRLDSPATSQTGAEFGAAVDMAEDGGWIAVGSPLVDRVITPGERVDVGAVYVFEHVGFTWQLEALLRPPGASDFDHFGASVSLHDSFLVAGSPGEDVAVGDEGAAYVYHLAGGEWGTLPRLRLVDSAGAESDALGTSVVASDLGALVGAPRANGGGVFDAGAALFYRDAGAFFDDGFESGDSSAWSLTVP